MSEAKEPFLERWSRLKIKDRETASNDVPAAQPAPPPAKTDEPPAPLPKIEELTPESDFRPFMNANVDPATRRGALKKLFAGDAHFNVPDPFEAYSEDYTGGEPIPPEMLKTLNQAKKLLFDEPEKAADAVTPSEAEPPAADAKDVAGSKDA
jgi:hypothetical protein